MIHDEIAEERVDPSEHIKLARHLASKVLKWFDKESQTLDHDIYGEAMLGLVLAAKTYDPSQKSFATWAQYKIRGQIDNYIEKESKYRSRSVSLESLINGSESDTRVAVYPEGLTSQQISDFRNRVCGAVASGESEVSHEMQEIYEALDHIGGREIEVIDLRMKGQTLAEIGERIGLSRERVRQIEKRGISLVKERISLQRGAVWA